MSERWVVRLLIAVALFAAAVRLLMLGWLHPLNWDEVEYFRATDWVRQGLVPYRDFWEHHTPLQWFLFAPITALTSSPGTSAVLLMRWAQVPLWIVTFWLMNAWMRRAGLSAAGRWTAMAAALCSSLFMLPAIEYRVDAVACAAYALALVLLQRMNDSRLAGFAAGFALCLGGYANLRLGPLLAVTAILAASIDASRQRWRLNWNILPVAGGVLTGLAAGLAYFAATGSLRALYQDVWIGNYLGEGYAPRVAWAFVHRILVPFGVRIYGASHFEWSGIDVAGIVVLVLGAIGLISALRLWRAPGWLFMLALLQIANIVFLVRMKYVYHYHLEIVVILLLPFIAAAIDRLIAIRPEQTFKTVPVVALIAFGIAAFLVVFRGKERDLAYQDLIMREADARTPPHSTVFDGVGWALRRRPAYRFWFLPELARQLVAHADAAPYRPAEWAFDPPAAVITDRNAAVWLAQHRELGAFVAHHYLPFWRNLWLPALSARLDPAHSVAQWYAPADGAYRLFISPALAAHPWLQHPLAYGLSPAGSLQVGLPESVPNLLWYVNNRPAAPLRGVLNLHRRDAVTVVSVDQQRLGVFLIPGTDTRWFRQPPAGVTLDSEGPRTTHLPDMNVILHGLDR